MSELPRTDDLPLEAERMEEALALFAERVRELESVTDDLRAELRSLRAERAAAPAYEAEEEVWPVSGAGVSAPAPSPDWMAAVPPPLRRPTAVPRLALEAGFLVLVALLAGLADLSAAWIVLVMAVAWSLVALSEWAAAAKRTRWRLDEVAPPAGEGAAETTGPWDMPVIHATVVETPDQSESHTVIAKLPDEPEASADARDDEEPEAERGRRLRFWRRAPVETAPDPWEA
jgi:hypothetical protein